jgi:nitrogen fixation NifU-like protein
VRRAADPRRPGPGEGDDLRELYQELILDHGKAPRNHRAIEGAARRAEGYNPLCGDRVTVYLDLADHSLRDVSFTGSGCAICTASASMMTQALHGTSRAEALETFDAFIRLVTGPESPAVAERLGKLAALSGVRRFPMRVKCATLPWHTMKAALEEGQALVTTE